MVIICSRRVSPWILSPVQSFTALLAFGLPLILVILTYKNKLSGLPSYYIKGTTKGAFQSVDKEKSSELFDILVFHVSLAPCRFSNELRQIDFHLLYICDILFRHNVYRRRRRVKGSGGAGVRDEKKKAYTS